MDYDKLNPDPSSTQLDQDILPGQFYTSDTEKYPPVFVPPSKLQNQGKPGGKNLPTGTVTFLFTDIEGSTPRWESQPEQMRRALEVHNALISQAITAQDGIVFKFVGDAFQAAFPTAQQALLAAMDAQKRLQAAVWAEPGPLRVRMGLHTGEARLVESGEDYAVAHTFNRAARIMSAGYGGQILLSSETAELCTYFLPPGVHLKDLGKHSLKGLSRAEHLYQVLAPGLQEGFPPLATQHRPEHNLPHQLTGFIGRQDEIGQVSELIASHPLVTLTGSGGVGKTRLSLQTAERVLEQFPDGVWYVELAPVSDPNLVPQTLAAVLSLREEPGRPLLDTLAHFLRDRQVLLVLDNCEHLLEACAQLAGALLQKAPRLKILASSREALGIAGESAFRVPSLAAPDPRHMPPLAEFVEFEAVRLFAERARAVLPSFQVDEQNAAAIAQICQRLDGIPLALELAAARLNLLTTGQLASRLDHAFRLLTGGSRTALPRQQTLRAAIDWSYQLLSEKEQRLLRRLAVFAGGGTLDAVESICSGEGLDAEEILDLLTGLANKSMVNVERLQHAETRYRLLETVRQYAGELLASKPLVGEILSGDGESVFFHDRHLDYYLELAETIEPQLRTSAALEKLAVLNRETDNFRASLSWSLDGEDIPRIEAGLRLASALLNLWQTQNYHLEGHTWLEMGLSMLPEEEPAFFKTRAKACFVAGFLLFPGLGQLVKAQNRLNKSLEIYHKIGDKSGQAMAQSGLAGILAWIGESPSRAKELCAQSVAVARTLNDPWLLAWTLSGYGVCAERLGDLPLARQCQEESLMIYERVGERLNVGVVYLEMGWISLYQGDGSAAVPYFRKALAAGQSKQYSWLIASALCGFGMVGYYQENFEAMEANFHLGLEKYREREAEENFGSLFCQRGIGVAVKRQGKLRQSAACFLESLPMAREDHDLYGVYAAIAGFAGAAALLGFPKQAARLLGAVEALFAAYYKPMDNWELREFNRDTAAARAALSREDFNQAWGEGRMLTLEAAIQEINALGVEIEQSV